MKPKQQKALAALIACRTLTEAAEETGISRETMYEYMKDPEFSAEYKKALADLVTESGDLMKRSTKAAVERLNQIIADDESKDMAKIAAIRTLLEYNLKYSEFADVLRVLNDDVLR